LREGQIPRYARNDEIAWQDEMINATYSVHIDAAPERVWRETVDIENWAAFAGQMQSVKRIDSGDFRVGSSARVTPKQFWSSLWTVTEMKPGRSFTWGSTLAPGLHVVAGHVVEPEDGGTRLTLSLRSSGPGALVAAPLTALVFRRNLRQEGNGLKRHVEASSTDG
jgi:uncharacterized protein YndB with AHSA1/START domain